jgi:hypothetical protein
MTPKEKAEELVKEFYPVCSTTSFAAEKCALILVDKIIDQWDIAYGYIGRMEVVHKNIYDLQYWQMVKVELNKML